MIRGKAMHVMLLGKLPPTQGGVSRTTWLAANDIAAAGHTVTALSNGTAMERGFRQMMTGTDEAQFTKRRASGLHCQMIEAVRPHAYIPWAPPYLSQLIGLGLEEAATHSPDAIVGCTLNLTALPPLYWERC
jgi:hypothetical protein